MRRLTRALAAFAPTLPLVLLGIGATGGPASAAGCYGYTCHGYDMYHFGCTYDTSTSAAAIGANNTVLAYVYNRYSSGCHSNWSEAQLTSAGYAAGDTISAETSTTDSHIPPINEVIYAPTNQDNQGRTNEAGSVPYGGTSSIYTDMVDGTNLVTSDVLVWHGTTSVAIGETTQ
jgi:hypothetical protein